MNKDSGWKSVRELVGSMSGVEFPKSVGTLSEWPVYRAVASSVWDTGRESIRDPLWDFFEDRVWYSIWDVAWGAAKGVDDE